jgi:hypothetical protein
MRKTKREAAIQTVLAVGKWEVDQFQRHQKSVVFLLISVLWLLVNYYIIFNSIRAAYVLRTFSMQNNKKLRLAHTEHVGKFLIRKGI